MTDPVTAAADAVKDLLRVPTHDDAQTVLLHKIYLGLKKLAPWKEFGLPVTINTGDNAQIVTGAKSPGTLRGVHNPTAGALTVTLWNSEAEAGMAKGTPLFSCSIAAGQTSPPLALPFEELWATAGTGARVFGAYRPST